MTQARSSRPMEGDTKPCPQCRGMLVFSRHCAVLAVGVAYQSGTERGNRIRYVSAWLCRNGGCDYREELSREQSDEMR